MRRVKNFTLGNSRPSEIQHQLTIQYINGNVLSVQQFNRKQEFDMSSKDTFASFLNSELEKRGWTNREFSDRARVSFRAIGVARSGALDELVKGKMSHRKKIGISASTYRMLSVLTGEPQVWMKKLGLKIPAKQNVLFQGVHQRVQFILSNPIASEDLEQFVRLQKELGDLFTVEIALSLLLKKHGV